MRNLSGVFHKKNVLILFSVIFLLGAFLRFYHLGTESLWNDEIETYTICSYDNFSDVMNKGILSDIHPPAHYILTHYVIKYFGDSEFAMRFPSVLAGIFCILFIFLIGVQLYSYREGLLAALMMAVSFPGIQYSQEARAYSLLLLFTLMAMYFWIHILAKVDSASPIKKSVIICYILSAVIACYLHFFGLFFIALHACGILFLLIKKKRIIWPVVIMYSLIFIAFVPWIPVMLGTMQRGDMVSWIGRPSSSAFFKTHSFFFGNSDGISGLALLAYIILFFRYIKTKEKSYILQTTIASSLLVVLWLFLPFTIIYIKSLISAPLLIGRYLIISLAAAYLLFSRSILELPIKSKKRNGVMLGVILLMFAHLLFFKQYYTRPQKEQYREAVEFITEQNKNYGNSLILGYNDTPRKNVNKEVLNYYFERIRADKKVELVAGKKEDIVKVRNIVEKEKPEYIWFFKAHGHTDKEFMDFISTHFNLVLHKKFKGTEVLLLKNEEKRS
ncbi:glycosyltransferase family 39 protein [bacterium]